MILSAAVDGWGRLRSAVFRRDRGCVAVQARWFGDDVAKDLCRDAGGFLMRWDDIFKMEWDHVTDRSGIRRDDEAHGITVCPWHHRGSGWRSDTSEHRAREREVLAEMYPEAWPSPG